MNLIGHVYVEAPDASMGIVIPHGSAAFCRPFFSMFLTLHVYIGHTIDGRSLVGLMIHESRSLCMLYRLFILFNHFPGGPNLSEPASHPKRL